MNETVIAYCGPACLACAALPCLTGQLAKIFERPASLICNIRRNSDMQSLLLHCGSSSLTCACKSVRTNVRKNGCHIFRTFLWCTLASFPACFNIRKSASPRQLVKALYLIASRTSAPLPCRRAVRPGTSTGIATFWASEVDNKPSSLVPSVLLVDISIQYEH